MDKELPLCECGCGQEVKSGNRFINGHSRRGVKISNPMMDRINIEGITQDIVKELFDYRDGNLYWKVSNSNRVKIGDLAGNVEIAGYIIIGINGKTYKSHRLIFLYHNGFLPEFLDHIDGNPSNNSIDNLREATPTQNQMNSKKHKSMNGKAPSSKYKGVAWNKRDKTWQAYIMIDYKLKHLGRFTSEIEAAEAYNILAIKHFGEFACLNIVPKRLYAPTPIPIYGEIKMNIIKELPPMERKYMEYLRTPRTTDDFKNHFSAKSNTVWQILRTLRLRGLVMRSNGTWKIVVERPSTDVLLTQYQREILLYLRTPHRTSDVMEHFTKTYQSAIQVIRTLRLMELVESAGRCPHPDGRCFAWITTHKGMEAL